ncbi:mobile mystery protein B [Specibacter cremeus]|uniref:mobile mystery protein B n=1 Tax=Specibacter cremeus TaxID=1629051 RepID=UPI000F788E18|nr:mobile mystery protein B [Specibacter cremeus]
MTRDGGPRRRLANNGATVHTTRYGQTAVDPDAYEFLTPRYGRIETLAQLNEAEAQNIGKALAWLERQTFDPAGLLSQATLRRIHATMFADVWTWAGTYRNRETNIGVDPAEIPGQLEVVLGNALWQVDNASMGQLEIGARLHRSLTAIHAFPNGNGRHARIFTEQFARSVGLPADTFTWGFKTYTDPATARSEYLNALRHADMTDDHGPLIRIATA